LILENLEKVPISEIKEVIPNRNTSEILLLCRDNDYDESLDKWQRLIINQRDIELETISSALRYKVHSRYFDDPRRTFNVLIKD
jgi:hypothetical protein